MSEREGQILMITAGKGSNITELRVNAESPEIRVRSKINFMKELKSYKRQLSECSGLQE